MSKTTIKPVVAALGLALVGSLSVANLANAAENPFAAKSMGQGSILLAEADKAKGEGKCGAGKCGGDKKAAEGKCGGDKKAAEGKCGGDKKAAEGKCGGDKKAAEGKCGGAK